MRILRWSLAVALLLLAPSAAGAAASPIWKFDGNRLAGSETIGGSASGSSLTIPGLTTECDLSYEMAIFNTVAEVGKGDIFALSFSNCTTASEFCTVKSIAAESLSWPLHLVTISSSDYVIVENVRISILYGGELCALGGTVVKVTGSAGGLFNNSNSQIEFGGSTLTATGTELRALSKKITWNCVLTTEALGSHLGHELKVG